MIRLLLYSTEIIPALPELISTTRDGDYTLLTLAQNIQLRSLGGVNVGMYYAVQCSEEIVFTTPEAVAVSGEGFERIHEGRAD